MPIFYECQRCTACCRWPGQVRITDLEITAMAGHLGLSEPDFIQRFTRLASDRRGLSLQVRSNHDCVFLVGNDCRVQAVKPKQCRDFPNRWNFPGWQELCRAKPRMISEDEPKT